MEGPLDGGRGAVSGNTSLWGHLAWNMERRWLLALLALVSELTPG